MAESEDKFHSPDEIYDFILRNYTDYAGNVRDISIGWIGPNGPDWKDTVSRPASSGWAAPKMSRGGKGTSIIVNNLCFWPGSAVVIDPKGENATVTAARWGRGSAHCDGLGQTVHVLDAFKAAQTDDSYRSSFVPEPKRARGLPYGTST